MIPATKGQWEGSGVRRVSGRTVLVGPVVFGGGAGTLVVGTSDEVLYGGHIGRRSVEKGAREREVRTSVWDGK